MTKFYVMLQNFLKDQRGISAIEYAILVAVLVGIVLVGIQLFGTNLGTLFTDAAGELTDIGPATP